jgi:hypothetical protein
LYWGMSPSAFSSPLTATDSIYFTISTATSTGMGDIHPVTRNARMFVSFQMVVSVFLIVFAIGTVIERYINSRVPRSDDP